MQRLVEPVSTSPNRRRRRWLETADIDDINIKLYYDINMMPFTSLLSPQMAERLETQDIGGARDPGGKHPECLFR